MAKRKNNEDRSTSHSEISDSRETVDDEVEDENQEIMQLYKKLQEEERKLFLDEMRISIANTREECMIKSHFASKVERKRANNVTETSVDDDIKIITSML